MVWFILYFFGIVSLLSLIVDCLPRGKCIVLIADYFLVVEWVGIRLSPSSSSFLVSQVDGRPPCVNGDIAIQWEWSNFDPSQNQNPLTAYDKTLHNWLRPQDERVAQNMCQSAVRVRLGKYVKYSTKFFYFSPGLAYWRCIAASSPFSDICCFWCVIPPLTGL